MDFFSFKENIEDSTLLKIIKGSPLDEVIKENPSVVSDWQRGKDHALGYLVGQVMKKSKGKANPALAKESILKIIGPCGKN